MDISHAGRPNPADASAVPLSAYIHLPWCVQKCPYCDFNSHRAPRELPETEYVDALCADWRFASASERRPLTSVFFGGGTPSLFSGAAIGRVLETLAASPGLAPDCEITLEANPGAVEHGRFTALAAAGVNRLSLGVQSLCNDSLARLGRIHDANEAREALAAARRAGFDNINCDLMFGLPDQSPAAATADIDALIALAPEHISYYQLTYEPGTPFFRSPPARVDADTLADMAEAGHERLAAAGFERYEVSAWARPGARCRHNDEIWRFGDYIGVGAGAHGKHTDNDGGITRSARLRWPRVYLQSAGTDDSLASHQSIEPADRGFEYLLGALRRVAPVRRAEFEARTGLAWSQLIETCRPAIERGLLLADADALATTALGWRHLDTVLSELLPG